MIKKKNTDATVKFPNRISAKERLPSAETGVLRRCASEHWEPGIKRVDKGSQTGVNVINPAFHLCY